MDFDYRARLALVRSSLGEYELDGLLLTQPENVRYLSGLLGHTDFDVNLLLTAECTVVLTNDLYREAFAEPTAAIGATLETGRLVKTLAALTQQYGVKTVGYEARHLSVALLDRLEGALPECKWTSAPPILEQARKYKDEQELAALAEACRLTDLALERLLPYVKVGVTERELAQRLLPIIWEIGGDDFSFYPIIAVGQNAAKPHHNPGDDVVRENVILQFDLGVRKAGYGGDLSRVAVIGSLTLEDERVAEVVLGAQQLALDAVSRVADGRELDRITKEYILEQRLPPYTHGLGHGIGLDAHVHEAPTLHQEYAEAVPLEVGMVFTIEPGIYLPGRTGVRMEDVVCLTAAGVRQLSNFPRELIRL